MNVWDMRLKQGSYSNVELSDGWTTALVVLHGTIQVNGQTIARESQMVVLDRAGQTLSIEANNDAIVLLLSGEPIDEPVVGYGPFVMNSSQEIEQALQDFNSGNFGQIPH